MQAFLSGKVISEEVKELGREVKTYSNNFTLTQRDEICRKNGKWKK